MRRDTEGMTLDAYIDRLLPKEEQLYDKNFLQKRFQIKHNAMEMVSVEKKRFASLNDKRFYFMGGIVSLPFGHAHFRGEIISEFINQLFDFINAEQGALSKCERLRIFQTILNQPPQLYQLHSNVIAKARCVKNTQEYIVNGSWK